MPPIEVLLGAGGLAVAASAAVVALWRNHIEQDKATAAQWREERDGWKKLAQDSTPEIKRLNDLLEQAVDLLLGRRP